MTRVTQKHLTLRLNALCELLGLPTGQRWTRNANGDNVCAIGHYAIEPGSRTYGYHWKVTATVNDAGGETVIASKQTAGELLDWINGAIWGVYAERERSARNQA